MIEEYRFGSITIDGKVYDYDIEVRWAPKDSAVARSTGQASAAKGPLRQSSSEARDPSPKGLEVLKWGRKESHIIGVDDIKRAIEQNPDAIVIGTGESGMAKVSEECQEEIQSKGIKLIIDLTNQAVKTFNIINKDSLEEEGKKDKAIGLFHLTC